jgi:hypothetical protein
MTPAMMVATFAYGLLIIAVSMRKKNRDIHARLAASAILMDLCLVLVLQVQRHAIQTAVSFTLSPLQQSHVIASTIATLFYFPTLYYGSSLYRRRVPKGAHAEYRKKHLLAAKAAFFFRTLGFILMFSLLGRHQVN